MKKMILIAWLVLLTPSLGLAAFVDNQDGTVTDTLTGLMWQQATNGSMDWDAAISHCERLTLAGYEDWRLPNRREMRSIVDYSKHGPVIDTAYFPGTLSSYYWSSTTLGYYGGGAWDVDFSNGHDYDNSKSNDYYVRAVRAGQSRLLDHLIISSPVQGSVWKLGDVFPIRWDTAGLGGNVVISLSRQGGKSGSFTVLAAATANDGIYDWTVTGDTSPNCMLKIVPAVDTGKETVQGLFQVGIPSAIFGTVTDLGTGSPLTNAAVSTTGKETQTASNGSYELVLDPGVYDVTFSKTGYQTVTIKEIVITKGQQTEQNVLMTTGPLNITTTSLPPGETGNAYNAPVRITGGTYPYTWSIPYGSLPPGLTLDAQYGNIAGTPTTQGSYTFGVGVKDAAGATTESEFTVEITAQLSITTTSPLPRGTVGVAYFQSIAAVAGTSPYSFSITAGSLPSELTLSSDGALSGTPTNTGAYDFTVTITDASSRTAEKSFHLEIVNALVITTSRLNDGITGQAYNQTLAASGGYGDHTWAVYAGILPSGLSFGGTGGVLSGTPTEATYGTIVFSVTDTENRVAYKDLTLQVADPLQIDTSALPNGLITEPYSEAIRTKAGISPLRFSYTGALPAGLSLAGSTGIISGTPTAAGLKNVEVTVADSTYPSTQSVTQYLSIRITSVLTILTSAVLPNAKKGVAVNPVILQAAGGPSPYTWAVAGGYMPEGISLDGQTGEVSGTPLDKGDFVFTLQVTDANSATSQKEFFLHVSGDLTITTGAIPDGAKDVSYNFVLEAKGGLYPYTWRLKSGTLPTGLSFSPDTGAIYGTPTTRQSYSFTVEVNDNDSPAQTAEKTYVIEILDDLYVYTATLPNGRTNEAYTATISAQLGTPPYSWRVESGVLPPGLSLTSSPTVAAIAGTATTSGTYTFTLEVTDTGTPVKTATHEYTVNIYGDVVIGTTGLKCAYRGVPYSDTVAATGGAVPYAWSVTEGGLPAGFTLNSSTGHISGITSLATGHSSTFTIRVTDSGNPYGRDEKGLVIYVVDPLAITTDTIQKAMQKSAYQATLAGQGGISPYTWSIATGALPEGLQLDPSSGVLFGTSVVCGIFDFTVKLQDSASVPNETTHAYSLSVLCCNDYDISGTVPSLSGVTMTLGGDGSGTTATDANGNYRFQHLTNGSYTVTPAKTDCKFIPASRVATINNRDLTGVDFVKTFASVCYVNPNDAACGGNSPCYTSIQAAINAESTGTAILIAQGIYTESITLNEPKSLTLQGGWDSSFNAQTSNTTVIKPPGAPKGSLTLRMVTIKPR